MKKYKTLEKLLDEASNAYYALGLVMEDIESNAVDSYHNGYITYEQLQVLRGMIDYYMARTSRDN